MMTDTARPPLSVHRLLPGRNEDALTLRFSIDSLVPLLRWQLTGSPPGEHPTAFDTEWIGKDGGRRTEFPSGYHGAPVLGRRAAGALRAELPSAGEPLPLPTPGPGAEGSSAQGPTAEGPTAEGPTAEGPTNEDYVLYLVTAVADCVDTARTEIPDKPGEAPRHVVFRPAAVPAALPAFRVPQFPTAVYWNGWAADRLAGLLGGDLETRLCWSEDPAATPHPNPWLL